MKAIILRELKDRRYTLLAYAGIVLVLLVLYIALFPSVKNSMAQFQKIYESYPAELYKALGIDNLLINKIENYLAIEMYSIVWPIMAIMLGASMAGNAIAAQIESGVIGFYLSLPVSRLKLFVAKYLGGLIGIVIFVLASVTVMIPMTALVNYSVPVRNVLELSLLSLLFVWAIYAASMLLSALLGERSRVYMAVGGLLIAMYAANVIAGLNKSWEWLQNYSVFHYYNSQAVLNNGGLRTSSIVVFGVIIIVCTLIGPVVFRRKDISV